MRFHALGPLEVFDDDDRPINLESAKQRLLLAVLLCHRNHSVSVDRLIDVLWEGTPPKSCRTNLQVLVYRLRGALGKHRIQSGPSGYRLVVEKGELDVEEFETLTANGSPAEALRLWDADEPYAGLDDTTVVRDEAARLAELRMATLEARIDADLSAGRSGQLVPELRTLVDGHPLRERLRCQLMLALYRSRRAAEALDVYRDARETMVDELGIEPGTELRQLQQAILNEDASLDLPEPDTQQEQRKPHVVPAELPLAAAAFTGRHTEADRLVALLTETSDSTADDGRMPPIVAVSGTGGIGKSALANHVAHLVAELFPDGQLYIDMHGATPGVPPLSAPDVLGRFLRTLGVEDSQIPDDVDEAAAMFRSLTACRRLLIVLDDVDDAAQVRPLLPGSVGSAVLLTSRRVPAALDGAVHVRLDGLSDDEAVVLLARLAGTERVAAEPDAAGQIVRLCGRLPLAVRIAGARLAARPDWRLAALVSRLEDAQRRLDELEHADLAVRGSLGVSYDALPADAARLFDLMGSIDLASFCVQVSALLVGGTTSEAGRLLDQLVEAQLLMPTSDDRYTFHDLVRLYARERATTIDETDRADAYRRALHAYIATARKASTQLSPSTARRGDFGLTTEQLAHPGLDFPDASAAVTWTDDVRVNLSNLVCRPGPALERAALATALSMPFYIRGYWTELLAILQVLLELGERHDETGWQARAHHDIGLTYHRMRRTSEALEHLTAALERYRRIENAPGEANALTGLGMAFTEDHQLERAIPYYQAALRIRRELGHRAAEARALNNIGDNYARQGRHDEAIPIFVECIEVYREVGDRRSLGISLGNLASALLLTGRPLEAVPVFEEALPLRRERGDQWGEAAATWSLGQALHELGREDAARERWRAALDIVSELGRISAEEADAILSEAEPAVPESLRVFG